MSDLREEIAAKDREIHELDAALRYRCEVADEHQSRAVSAETTIDRIRAVIGRWEQTGLAPQTVQLLDELRFVLPDRSGRG